MAEGLADRLRTERGGAGTLNGSIGFALQPAGQPVGALTLEVLDPAVERVLAACRALTREAAALLRPEFARAYLRFHGGPGEIEPTHGRT